MTVTPFKLIPQGLFSAVLSESPARASEVASRWVAVPGGVVDGGEIVLMAVKPSPWRPLLDSAAWLVTCTLLATTLLLLGRPLPGLGLATSAQVVMFVAALRFAVAVVRWVTMWHLLTNRRIIDVSGVRAPIIRSCLLVHLRNTYARSSTIEKSLGLGTILLVTDEPEHRPHVWQSIPHPEETHAKVRRAIEGALDQCST